MVGCLGCARVKIGVHCGERERVTLDGKIVA